MKVIRKGKKQTEYELTQEEFSLMQKEGRLRGASVHETMGPNYKDIYWSPIKRPFVLK